LTCRPIQVACNFVCVPDVTTCRVQESFQSSNSGTIPTEIGLLTQVTVLAFGNQELTGTIPSTLGNLTRLRQLSLYTNQLNGPIPP
jgi:hypothetical protein